MQKKLQCGAHLELTMSRPYIRLLLSEMKFRVQNIIDVLLKKVSIKDGRRLIEHYIGILSFFTAAMLKTIKN